MLRSFLVLTAAASLHAATSIDIDLAKLRQAPDAAHVRQTLDALMPATVAARLQALDSLFNFDPRRDLTRVVIDLPDVGGPTIHLIGLPAKRIASALSLRGNAVALPGGQLGYILPRHPQALFVALGDGEALIGRSDRLTSAPLALFAAAAPSAGATISAHLIPSPHPRADFMTLVGSCDVASDGAGHVTIAITTKDQASAIELERRFGVMRSMVEVGTKGELPLAMLAEQLLDATRLTRSGAHLDLVAEVPADARTRVIDRLVACIGERVARRAGGAE